MLMPLGMVKIREPEHTIIPEISTFAHEAAMPKLPFEFFPQARYNSLHEKMP